MSSPASVRSAVLTSVLLLTAPPVLAQEASEPAPGDDAVTTSVAPVTLHTGYQASSHDALQGLHQTLVLGFRIGPAAGEFQQFFEVGIARLDVDDSPVVTSSALVGARLAWRWQRVGLHLMARLHHGDPATGADSVAISSSSSSLGLMASFDILHRSGRSLALALHGIGQFHDAADGEDATVAFAGGGGLSLVLW